MTTPCEAARQARASSLSPQAPGPGAPGRWPWTRALLLAFALASALGLGACSSLGSQAVRAAVYDFGPQAPKGLLAAPKTLEAPAARETPQSPEAPASGALASPLPLLVLAEVDSAGGLLDNVAVLYRLAYLNPLQLRPYAHAHWSMPPAQLVQQRMRTVLGQQRTVVPAGEPVALMRRPAVSRQSLPAGPRPLEMRLELEEFSHWFESPSESFGLLRLSVTLIEHAPAGARVLAQRQLVVRQPAETPDAAGGVRALALATDAAGLDLLAWLARAEAAR